MSRLKAVLVLDVWPMPLTASQVSDCRFILRGGWFKRSKRWLCAAPARGYLGVVGYIGGKERHVPCNSVYLLPFVSTPLFGELDRMYRYLDCERDEF